MSAGAARFSAPRALARLLRGLSGFWSGVNAVGIKELRGRMRDRRAFVVVTIYLALLSLFSWGIYELQRSGDLSMFSWLFGGSSSPLQTGRSAAIGQAIFSGLVVLETMLVLVLAPAFTASAFSLEREKQTLDLLVATPLGTVAMVVGKLLSALAYVFLLIVASIPLASIVFTFGGVGPDDLVRAYLLLFALAMGMGAVGLFFSALVRRTQLATVITYVAVLCLTLGTLVVWMFLQSLAGGSLATGTVLAAANQKAPPQQLLWLNPLAGDLDLMCGTALPGTYDRSCLMVSAIVGKPYFGGTKVEAGGVLDDGGVVVNCPPNADCAKPGVVAVDPRLDLSMPRDLIWPQVAISYTLLGLVLTVASTQLVAPTRRSRLLRAVPFRRAGRVMTRGVAGESRRPSDEAAP
ncbi:MAG TPA: ABC transporter permease subunit [Candidatus Limnocylindrales bacterium]|nr:ABC transporter permease subunit [Candidatus Limnocylindrales bacterium]